MIVEITVAKDGEGKILTLTAANLQDIKTLEEIFQTGHYLRVNRGQKIRKNTLFWNLLFLLLNYTPTNDKPRF